MKQKHLNKTHKAESSEFIVSDLWKEIFKFCTHPKEFGRLLLASKQTRNLMNEWFAVKCKHHPLQSYVNLFVSTQDKDNINWFRCYYAVSLLPLEFKSNNNYESIDCELKSIIKEGIEVNVSIQADRSLDLIKLSKLWPTNYYYYEVKLLNNQNSAVGIALAEPSFSRLCSNSFPGWGPTKIRKSVAFHSDDGCIFYEQSIGTPYADRTPCGSTMGLLFNFRTRSLYFTINGKLCRERKAFRIKNRQWIPTIGTELDCHVIYNLGSKPFIFNLEQLQKNNIIVSDDDSTDTERGFSISEDDDDDEDWVPNEGDFSE